jgi:hypothetical protein
MSARDVYHELVRQALISEGWQITHDPYRLSYGQTEVYADLGAELPIAAERAGEKIAVEIKTFIGKSEMHDLEVALGQFVLYRILLTAAEPDRMMFLAMPQAAFESLFENLQGRLLLEGAALKIITFDPETGVIVQWRK